MFGRNLTPIEPCTQNREVDSHPSYRALLLGNANKYIMYTQLYSETSLYRSRKKFRAISLKRVCIFSGRMEMFFIIHFSEYFPFKFRNQQ